MIILTNHSFKYEIVHVLLHIRMIAIEILFGSLYIQ